MSTPEQIVRERLGPPGRMISGSKTAYHQAFPTHRVFFNANLTVGGVKVWHGDLDLDDPPTATTLQAIADEAVAPVHVLSEAYRWSMPSPDEITGGRLAMGKGSWAEIQPKKEPAP
jgi:hypothetical protein